MMSSKKKTGNESQSKLTENQIYFNDMLSQANTGIETSCWWNMGSSSDGNTSGSNGGGDWRPWRDLQTQVALMWSGATDQSQGYRANVKSPEIAGRIDSTMQKLVKLNLEFVAHPKRPEVAYLKPIYQDLIDDAFKQNKYKFRLKDAFYDALVHGTAAVTVDYIIRKRKVKMPITNADDMTKEEKKRLKEKNEIPYREVTLIDKKGAVISNRDLNEILPDPSARNIREDLYYAGYYFDTMMMPYNRFMKHYKDRVGYIDIDKVRKASELADIESHKTPFFKPPQNMRGDFVYIVKMWDYDNDRFMVRANDIFIHESPLPYVHKDLNLILLTPKKLPNQLWGIGLVDMLLPVITQIELLQNAIYDYVMYTTNPVLMVEKNAYGDFSRHYRKARPGLMIPVMDVNRAVAPLRYAPLSMDVFQALSSLQRDATIASQNDPSQLGVIVKNATATANIINKEVMDAYVNYILVSLTEGLNEIATQVFSVTRQFDTVKDVRERLHKGEIKEVAEYKIIDTPNKEYEIDYKQSTVTTKVTPGKSGTLEIRPELFFYKNKDGETVSVEAEDFEFELSAESREIISDALEAQRAKENLAQLANYMVDPHDKEKMSKHLAPWINGPEFLQDFFVKQKIDTKYLINPIEEDGKSREEAMEHNKQIFNLTQPIPEVGASDVHLDTHEDFQETIGNMLKGLQAKRKESEMATMAQNQTMQSPMGQMPPQSMGAQGMPVGPQDAMAMQMMAQQQSAMQIQPDPMEDRLQKVLDMLAEHIKMESMPKYLEEEVMARMTATQTQQQPGAPMPAGYEAAPVIQGMDSGMPGAPNMARMAGYSQGGPGQLGGLAGEMVQ